MTAGHPLPILPARKSAPGASAPAGWPVLRLGFRPFYLGAALFGALAIPLWVALSLGQLTMTLAVPAPLWHAHEMLFGFAVAVIIGFLLTAAKAWTGLATPRGAFLGGLAGLWLAARLAAVLGFYPAYAVLDLLLLPLVAVVLTRIMLQAGNRRNLPLAGILMLLALANLAFHLSVIGWLDLSPLVPLHAALALIVLIECVMGGRVIPAFTMGATPGMKITSRPTLDKATLAATALALALWVTAPQGGVTSTLLLTAAVLQGIRQMSWKPWVTRGRPILWILHAAYAWLTVGLLLLALVPWGLVGATAGIHALAVGATGGLIIGMVTRTARGHTGRPLQVSRAEVLAYGLVMAAALVRVLLPLLAPGWLVAALVVSAAAWSLAFAVYLALYTPWLFQTRLDGKDG